MGEQLKELKKKNNNPEKIFTEIQDTIVYTSTLMISDCFNLLFPPKHKI